MIAAAPLLCADIGNSSLKLAVVSAAGRVLSSQRMPHPHLAKQPATLPWPVVETPPVACVLASVSNSAQTQVWIDAIREHYGPLLPITVIEPTVDNPYGIDLNGYPPEQLGSDRYINLITARQTLKTAAIIVDAGTATTVDWLTAEGTYLGGVILPGPETMTAGLQQATARLPRVSMQWQAHYPGDTTQHCLQAGLTTGYVGMLDAVLARGPFLASDNDVTLILTGGHGETIAQLLTAADHSLAGHGQWRPTWTVEGLASAWQALQPVVA